MPATPEQLKDRWKTKDGQRRLKAVLQTKSDDEIVGILDGFPFVDEVAGPDVRGAALAATPGGKGVDTDDVA